MIRRHPLWALVVLVLICASPASVRAKNRVLFRPTPVLAKPRDDAKVIARLAKGHRVKVKKKVGRWVQIRTRHKRKTRVGWISQGVLKRASGATPPGSWGRALRQREGKKRRRHRVPADALKARHLVAQARPGARVLAAPDTTAALGFELSPGDEVLVVATRPPWIEVQDARGRRGWIERASLSNYGGRPTRGYTNATADPERAATVASDPTSTQFAAGLGWQREAHDYGVAGDIPGLPAAKVQGLALHLRGQWRPVANRWIVSLGAGYTGLSGTLRSDDSVSNSGYRGHDLSLWTDLGRVFRRRHVVIETLITVGAALRLSLPLIYKPPTPAPRERETQVFAGARIRLRFPSVPATFDLGAQHSLWGTLEQTTGLQDGAVTDLRLRAAEAAVEAPLGGRWRIRVAYRQHRNRVQWSGISDRADGPVPERTIRIDTLIASFARGL